MAPVDLKTDISMKKIKKKEKYKRIKLINVVSL